MGESKKTATFHSVLCSLMFCNRGALRTGSVLGNPQEQSPGCPRGASEQRPAGTAPWRYRTRCTMPKTAQLCSRTWAKNLCPPLRSRHGAGQSILQGCRLTSITQDGFFSPKKKQWQRLHLLGARRAGNHEPPPGAARCWRAATRQMALGATPVTSRAGGEEKGDGASRKARRERRNCCHQLCSCSGS